MVDVTIPQIGESITTVFIARWIKKTGEAIEAGESLVELDSDKASMEVPSPTSGVVTETLAAEGDEVDIGSVIARIDETASAPPPTAASTDDDADADDATLEAKAGPAARQEARERGVDIDGITGTGRGGRVTTDDVRNASAPAAETESAAPERPATAQLDRIERVRMTPLRRTIARRLVEAQQNAAMLTTFNEVDMTAVMVMRASYKQAFVDKHGIKLGFMSFFVKAVIEGLKAFPAVNAEIDDDHILYKNFYNIGVAVSGPKGLVVPVVRDADRLSFAETELAISALAKKARDNRLRIDDFQGGTFTLSNGGIFGSMMSTPILNPPQSGILGMHNILQRPIGVDGQVVLRPMMYLAVSYDHRIIDGREAVSFLVRVKECIEDPSRILLEI